MPVTKKGTLGGFRGSWMSGLGYLIIDDTPVPCDNAPTVRALDGCFGDVIKPGHTVDGDAPSFVGREVVYSVDDMGVLLGFTPVEEWEGPEIPDEGIVEELAEGEVV
jgi:hypothetical protein